MLHRGGGTGPRGRRRRISLRGDARVLGVGNDIQHHERLGRVGAIAIGPAGDTYQPLCLVEADARLRASRSGYHAREDISVETRDQVPDLFFWGPFRDPIAAPTDLATRSLVR
jgi:hypothetical protein